MADIAAETVCEVKVYKSGDSYFVNDPNTALRLYQHRNTYGRNFQSKGGPIICDGVMQEVYMLSFNEILHLKEKEGFHIRVYNLERTNTGLSLQEVEVDSIWRKRNVLLCNETSCRDTAYLQTFRYFADRGWIVKDSIAYGTDYICYDGKPGQVHSTYSVLVTGSIFNWLTIQCGCRLSNQVRKKFVISTLGKDDEVELFHVEQWLV